MSEERERFERLDRYFDELELLTGERLEERLVELEASEPDLFPELRELLDQADSGVVRGFDEISLSASANLTAEPHSAADPPPESEQRIDRYRLIKRIGVGGMGEVWEGEQTEPVRRRVAVKVLLSGVANASRIARFEAERQALASMDHPNIARVFDGGTAPDGNPYFVMELVEGGVSITRYCTRHQLNLEQRLRLFLPVCQAVEHAHRKRVIHRDLKPSNVLITERPGTRSDDPSAEALTTPDRASTSGHTGPTDRRALPIVKVIDFGIAKPIEGGWGSETHATVAGELVATPEYMSPEQAALGAVDIDTRSDVFTLGLLLFELIVGDLPLSAKELRRMPFDELCRHIREDDTPTPSALLRKAQPDRGPNSRASTLSASWRRVQGDLDRIVSKALAKDRERRYGSAAELGDDLERFLAHEPVLATPPSPAYRMKKFLRRNRVAAAATAFLAIGLIVGLAVALVGFSRARTAEQEALASLAALERSENFLVELFNASRPGQSLGQDPPASELLRRGIDKLDELDDQPRVQGRLLLNLGEVQRSRGQLDEAALLLERSIEILNGNGTSPIDLAAAHARLGAVYRNQQRPGDAVSELREGLRLYLEHAPMHPGVGDVNNQLAIVLNDTGRFEQAAKAYRDLIAWHENNPESPPMAIAVARFNAATNLSDAGDQTAAVEQTVKSLELMRTALPENHPNLATVHSNLSVALGRQGETVCGLRHAREALRIDLLVLPANHPALADSHLAVGTLASTSGHFDAAREAFNSAATIYSAALGPRSERLATAEGRLADLVFLEGQSDAAARAARTFVDTLEARFSEASATVPRIKELAGAWYKLAVVLRTQALELERETTAAPARVTSILDQASEALERTLEVRALDTAAEENPLAFPVEFQRSLIEIQRGNLAVGEEFLARIQQLATTDDGAQRLRTLDDSKGLRFRAQLAALLGRQDLALRWFDEATISPARSIYLLRAPELDGLRSRPEFRSLAASVEKSFEEDPDTCPGLI